MNREICVDWINIGYKKLGLNEDFKWKLGLNRTTFHNILE